MSERVPVEDVLARRMRAHGLTERVPVDRLAEVVGACGVQDSPPGAALLAIHARVEGLTSEHLDRAITEDKVVVRTWAMRGAPFLVPTVDAAVFTTGVLPPTESAREQLILGVREALRSLGMGLDEAVTATRAETVAVLSGRRLPIGELGAEISARIAPTLAPRRRERWRAEGPYAQGQPLGEAVVHFCLRILTLEQVVCFAPREGASYPFVLVDEWLGRAVPHAPPDQARTELVRRYLRCHGPSTRAELAAWLGVRAGDATDWWDLVRDELTEVDTGRRSWLLTEDAEELGSAPRPQGVRLLPPRDPYTQSRDRTTILAAEHHRSVWKNVGEPGSVLVDGRIVGTWRSRAASHRLTVTVTPFVPLTQRHADGVRTEAESLGRLRGATSVEVVTAPT
ncbi:winged helix DNA-binding domain-containing protein [Janibacter sp. DB-40]|uniref:winged helix DNA-binding domain-containing protein n=1 Tax=Janibacter sp. DB-40 TaxID=3028808 RepID=UPI0024068170|nr:winged helix DNA-binding domain-containing protein [Janibacter sp. DB-40]